MDENRLKKAISIAHQATEKDNEGKYAEALTLYKQCLENWQIVYKYQDNINLKKKLYEKMEPYIKRAETIKEYLLSQKKTVVPVNHSSFSETGKNDKSSSTNVDNSNKDNKAHQSNTPNNQDIDQINDLSSVVMLEKSKVRWDDVAGLEKAKNSLKETVILPSSFPQFFTGLRKPWKGILLYGPPGTGKTQLAKACAGEANATFLSVSSADLISKWQGESEKLVRKLFNLARKMSPSVIFVDEIDSLCSARSEREGECSRRIKTEFLVQMEGLHSNDTDQENSLANRILVLGATNEPWTLDAAIRRRFERRIYIPLPDLKTRFQILQYSLTNTSHSLSYDDLMMIATLTEGFSGADISILVRDALFEPIRFCQTAEFFKQVNDSQSGNQVWHPCEPDDTSASKKKISLMELKNLQVIPGEVTLKDFRKALANTKPSVNASEISRHEEWTKRFGVE